MSTYLEGFKGYYDTFSNYIETYVDLPEENKNHMDFLQFSDEYKDVYQKELSNVDSDFLKNARQLIVQIMARVKEHDAAALRQLKQEVCELIDAEEKNVHWAKKINRVLQNDFKKERLRDEQKELLQSLIDQEMKEQGRISDQTMEVLQIEKFTVINGVIYEDNKEVETQEQPVESKEKIQDLGEFVHQHKEKLKKIQDETGKKTLVVNALAGPGAGKTTACLETVAALKKMGYVAEYISEYAKELVYDDPQLLDGSKENQLHILSEQIQRMDRFIGKVDIIVTDSPILLNAIYLAEPDEMYEDIIVDLYEQYTNFNFYVHRGLAYEQKGRMENQEESFLKDQQIRDLLDSHSLFYGNFNHRTVDNLASKIDMHYKKMMDEKVRRPFTVLQQDESYQAIAYHGKEGRFKVVYGSSPEELLTKLQGWNQGRTDDMKFHNAYIRKFNTQENRYGDMIRYDVLTGKDITPIYLNLPHMSKEVFAKVTKQLKEDGAKYSPTKKAWYVTKENDLNKFSEYLPIVGTHAAVGVSRSKEEISFSVDVQENNAIIIRVEEKKPFEINGDNYNMDFHSIQKDSLYEFVERFILPDAKLQPINLNLETQKYEYEGNEYSSEQYAVIQLAISQGMDQDALSLICDPSLTNLQMQQVRHGIRDGLDLKDVEQYAKSGIGAWQMDLCRYGMNHGLTFEEIKPFIKSEKRATWIQRRQAMDKHLKKVQKSAHTGAYKSKDGKMSVKGKLEAFKGKIEGIDDHVAALKDKKLHRERD